MRLATLQIKSINEIYSVAHTNTHTQTRRSLDVQRLFGAYFLFQITIELFFVGYVNIYGHTPQHCFGRDYSLFLS